MSAVTVVYISSFIIYSTLPSVTGPPFFSLTALIIPFTILCLYFSNSPGRYSFLNSSKEVYKL